MDKVFEQNPDLKEYYKTSDGQPFYTENAATLHARKLENKKIEHVQRAGDETPKTKASASPKTETSEAPEKKLKQMNKEELNTFAEKNSITFPADVNTNKEMAAYIEQQIADRAAASANPNADEDAAKASEADETKNA